MPKNKHGISKSRQRKIDHLREISQKEGWSKSKLRQKALHHMKMRPEDVQVAFDGLIY